jgi:tetratricopeptide (TPR) repeat protein
MMHKTLLFTLAIIALCAVTSQAQLVIDPNAANAPSKETIDQIHAQWAQRDTLSGAQKTAALLEKQLAENPTWEQGWHWLGYARFMEGDALPAKSKGRKASFEAGMEAGKKAIALNETGAGGHHWYITNKACYGRERGILRSVVYLPEILREVETVKKFDKKYDGGGPQRLLTGIILAVPGSLRKAQGYSLEDAANEMKEAIQVAPKHPRNLLFLADVYIEMGKKAEAKVLLDKLLSMTPDQCPGLEPELRQDQASAKKRLADHFAGE